MNKNEFSRGTFTTFVIALILSSYNISALQLTPLYVSSHQHFYNYNAFNVPKRTLALHMAKKSKGFNKSISNKAKEAPKSKTSNVDVPSSTPNPSPGNEDDMNAGQKALAKLRAQQQSTKDDELRKIQEIRSIDEFIRDDPTAAVIPEKVAMRMGSRMLPFVGIPLFGTMAAFIAFWYLRVYKNIEFETNIVAFTTIGLLAVGLLVSCLCLILIIASFSMQYE